MDAVEFKEKYPQYKEIPDEELAGRLYEKHYAGKISKKKFLKEFMPFDGDTAKPKKEKTFPQKAVELMTGGHVRFGQEPPPEVETTPEGELKVNVPETAAQGFFEDPVTAVAFGSAAALRYAGSPVMKALHGVKEAVGWMTGGASEVPVIAKGLATKGARAVSARTVEKTMAGAQEMAAKGVGVKATIPMASAGQKAIPKAGAKIIEPELSRSEMIKEIENTFNVPIRKGRHRLVGKKGRALGIYKVKPEVIRLKHASDIEVAAHEAGHHIQKVLGYPRQMPAEVQRMAYSGADDVNAEGFAEFIRVYVTDRPKAKKLAPKYFDDFEKSLEQNPEIQSVFNRLTDSWNQWLELPSYNKVKSYIKSGNEIPGKKTPTFEDIYTNFVDEFHPIKKLTEYAAKVSKSQTYAGPNPFELATLTRGWPRKAEQFLRYKPFIDGKDGVEFVGKSLKNILKPVESGGRLADLDAYLVAKRALHDQRIISGFGGQLRKSDFRQTVKEGEKEFGKVAQELYSYQNTLLNHLVSSGRISAEQSLRIAEKNLFYAPLYRVMGIDLAQGGRMGKKFTTGLSPIHTLKGVASDIVSPVENMVYNTYTILSAAEKNKVGRAIAKMSDIEGIGKLVERVPAKQRPIKLTRAELDKLEASFTAGSLEEAKEIATIFRRSASLEPNEVEFFVDGVAKRLIIGDEALAKAIKGLDAESVGVLTKILSVPAKWLRVGATLSPEFIMRNPFRDQVSAFLYSKYGYIPGYNAVKGIAHILGKTETYQRFNASGAAHAALVSMDRDYLSRGLKELLKGNMEYLKIYKNPLKPLQALSELMEEATRVAEFARVLKVEGAGKAGAQAAALAARTITLDFSRIGTKTKAYNMITAFANAQIQGTDKLVRAFMERPLRTSVRAVGGITVPSVLLWYVNKDDPYYQELPAWRKTLCWNFIFHNEDGSLKRVASFPKPFDAGIIFGSLPEAFLDYAYTKDPAGIKDGLEKMLDALAPGILPTASIPLIENFANRSVFFDRPIFPREREGASPEFQYGPRTSETMQLVGQVVSKIPVANKFASPAKLENLVKGWTGGLGRLGLQASDKLMESFGIIDVAPKPEATLSDVPGIRGFIARYPSSNTASIEQFYKELESMRREVTDIRLKMGLEGLGVPLPKEEKLEKYEDTANTLKFLRQAIMLTYQDKTMQPKQKSQARDELYNVMIETARVTLGKKPLKNKGGATQ